MIIVVCSSTVVQYSWIHTDYNSFRSISLQDAFVV